MNLLLFLSRDSHPNLIVVSNDTSGILSGVKWQLLFAFIYYSAELDNDIPSGS